MSESGSSNQTATHDSLAIANYFVTLSNNNKKAKEKLNLVAVTEIILYCPWF